ncbi:ABC transporter, substrate-binding protein (cluster 5, nickel/peptides/opines) [hydrothermal vent metagenome]|uniref:ABC transporter, substrate-binding protein (Cluster 5, nickel/peptides/opines) n=1 Tax=hydrothermal vent metagenome TaxID=652676 RepID=A0A3B0TD93_9ZZZZ
MGVMGAKTMRRTLAVMMVLVAGFAAGPLGAQEPPEFGEDVKAGKMAPTADRLPSEPLVVDLGAAGLETGRHGGRLRTLVEKAKGIRYMSVYGYARLVGYDAKLNLKPDLLKAVKVEEGRIFTLVLRKGHKWSDGQPFTSEDFRYYWEDVANNKELTPSGPDATLLFDGEPPKFEVIDEVTVRFSWSRPNPNFLPLLAQARPPYIYRPAHYLKQFHKKYGDADTIAAAVKIANVRFWATLHNRRDNMYNNDNPDLPTLDPWVNTTVPPSTRFVFKRNPYFHRVDAKGLQLPYIGEVIVSVASNKLIPAKAVAGESDLQSRGLSFGNIAILKQGEGRGDYRTLLWPIGKSSHMALYPNLNTVDDTWRKLMRTRDFRAALSLGIDRSLINRTLFLGLARPVGNTVLPASSLYVEENALAWAEFDTKKANALLDGIGLSKRDSNGYRLLPDGRRAEIIVETAGEDIEQVDILQLIAETWKEIGIKLFTKPSQRDVLRERSYAGQTMMTVWSGWNLGAPSPIMSPQELAPTRQDNLGWPKWGQYYQTKGQAGDAPDMEAAKNLMALYGEWQVATNDEQRKSAWAEMLKIHAEEQFLIGVISGVRQPIVASKRLRNIPEDATYSWEPGALFGIFRPDQFWFAS